MLMLSQLRSLLLGQNVDSATTDVYPVPAYNALRLLTSDHVETFNSNFYRLRDRLEDAGIGQHTAAANRSRATHEAAKLPTVLEAESEEEGEAEALVSKPQRVSQAKKPSAAFVSAPSRTTVPHETAAATTTATTTASAATNTAPTESTQIMSPSKSDEGYGSFSGEEGDETLNEIAALGIITEGEELPDYGVSLTPARIHHPLSPPKKSAPATPDISQTKPKTANDTARKVLAMGYALSLLGEKFEKPKGVEGSVKDIIVKASQAIERGSVSGSQYARSNYNKSRYGGGSRYGGSRYGGSKFGGSQARSVVLEENLPSWGF